MILVVLGAACLLIGAYGFMKPDEGATDLAKALHGVNMVSSKFERLNEMIQATDEKLDSYYQETHATKEALADLDERNTKALKTVFEDLEKISMRQVRMESKIGSDKSLNLKVVAPIPVEVVPRAPAVKKKAASK